MNEQIECSLPVAIKFCREKNGRARRKDGWDHAWYDKSHFDSDEPPVFGIGDITATWIYEPPESPFKIWNATMSKDFFTDNSYLPNVSISRKEGWNAALDEAQRFSLLHKGIIYDDLEKLREK